MEEKKYLFNPWNIKSWKEEQILTQVNKLIGIYNPQDDTMYGLSRNIEIIADITYLYGEMISRLAHLHSIKKLDNDAKRGKYVVQERKTWEKAHPKEKVPAITYFESEADELVRSDRDKEAQYLEDLNRFKYAYESMEHKMNALKRKVDSIRYEEFNK